MNRPSRGLLDGDGEPGDLDRMAEVLQQEPDPDADLKPEFVAQVARRIGLELRQGPNGGWMLWDLRRGEPAIGSRYGATLQDCWSYVVSYD